MQSRLYRVGFVIMLLAVSLSISACRRQTAKFQPGDKVRLKYTGAEGVVVLRTRFFQENLYHITVAGTNREHYPKGENERRTVEWAQNGVFTEWLKPSHDEGPYYENELERIP